MKKRRASTACLQVVARILIVLLAFAMFAPKAVAEELSEVQEDAQTTDCDSQGDDSCFDLAEGEDGSDADSYNAYGEQGEWEYEYYSIWDCNVSSIPDYYWTGYPIEPKPSINYMGFYELEEGSDYTLSYSDNVDTGLASVTITGLGQFYGSRTEYFSILLDSGTWRKSGNRWWYSFDRGGYARECYLTMMDGSIYYFDSDGWMVTGWWVDYNDGETRYFKPSGVMAFGWQKIGGKWYYFDWSNGAMWTGLQEISGDWYWFSPSSGAMATGWREIDGEWRYFKPSGVMAFGWQKIGGKWYYFDWSNGAMWTGLQEISGDWYWFSSSGAMATGWKKIDGDWYYFKSSGAMAFGWQKVGGTWYFLNDDSNHGDGRMVTGWLDDGSKTYYLKSSGVMATGWQKIDGDWYFFSSGGVMARSKWVQKWYYVDADGIMMQSGVTPDGYRIVNGKWDGKGKVA